MLKINIVMCYKYRLFRVFNLQDDRKYNLLNSLFASNCNPRKIWGQTFLLYLEVPEECANYFSRYSTKRFKSIVSGIFVCIVCVTYVLLELSAWCRILNVYFSSVFDTHFIYGGWIKGWVNLSNLNWETVPKISQSVLINDFFLSVCVCW